MFSSDGMSYVLYNPSFKRKIKQIIIAISSCTYILPQPIPTKRPFLGTHVHDFVYQEYWYNI